MRTFQQLPRSASVAVASMVAALGLAGCGGSGVGDAKAASYVALGDSYSSGAGIAPTSDEACARSSANYPSLIATQLGYDSFTDVTCGGATTDDLTHEQANTSNGPQLEALGRGTRLVTLTIGLNDRKVSSGLLFACLSESGRPSAWCEQMLGVSDGGVEQVIARAAEHVEKAMALIRRRAPKARIILVGYPRLLPDEGDCPDRIPMVPAMEPRVRLAMETANEQWRRAAEKVDADYIDTWTMSKGHDICSADPWVNGATNAPGRAAPLHPFPAFHEAVAKAIIELLKAK